MKTETNIVSRIIKLKEILEPSKTLYILCVFCIFLGLIILLFAYQPLIVKLHNASNKVRESEIELLNQNSAIAVLDNTDIKGKIIQQNEIPSEITELTKKGRELGLDFNSISPGELQDTTQAGIWKLPIGFTIESEYKNLGQFLAFVEEFSSSIIEVESLSIHPKDKNLHALSVELVLCLYVEIENAVQ
jgi:Tfp pilus assembly protein PilO